MLPEGLAGFFAVPFLLLAAAAASFDADRVELQGEDVATLDWEVDEEGGGEEVVEVLLLLKDVMVCVWGLCRWGSCSCEGG